MGRGRMRCRCFVAFVIALRNVPRRGDSPSRPAWRTARWRAKYHPPLSPAPNNATIHKRPTPRRVRQPPSLPASPVPDRYAPPDPRPTLPPERRADLRARLAEAYADTAAPRVVRLFEKAATGVLVRRATVEVAEGVGLAGDHAAKDFWRGRRVAGREVSVGSREVLDLLGVDLHMPGDNVIIEGLDLRGLAVGQRIVLGAGPEAVVLERSAAVHRPCGLFADRAGADAYAFAYAEDLRGILCFVRRGGTVREGDPVRVIYPDVSSR